MWIFHPKGFASIVEDQDDHNFLICRSRFKGDLNKLFPGCQVSYTEHADYQYRTRLRRAIVMKRVAELTSEIDYLNFRDACPTPRHKIYLQIWSLLRNVTKLRL